MGLPRDTITAQVAAVAEDFLLSDFFEEPTCKICGAEVDYYQQVCEREDCKRAFAENCRVPVTWQP